MNPPSARHLPLIEAFIRHEAAMPDNNPHFTHHTDLFDPHFITITGITELINERARRR